MEDHRIHCTNCRESRPWSTVKKIALGGDRFTLVCDQCSMSIKVIEKSEADIFQKEFGPVVLDKKPISAVPPTSDTPVAGIKAADVTPTVDDIATLKKDLEEKAKAILAQLDNLKAIEDKIKK